MDTIPFRAAQAGDLAVGGLQRIRSRLVGATGLSQTFDIYRNTRYRRGVPKPLPVLTDTAPICCPPLDAPHALTDGEAVALAVRMKALADPSRLRLVSLLLGSVGREASTRELARLVGLSEPTVSHHLKTLETAGLVSKVRRGGCVDYRVVPEAVVAIGGALNLTCC
jgi:ArsR family transcriptional regulator, arsenate/arsenite/antimonite-responsive transcriptional repressor